MFVIASTFSALMGAQAGRCGVGLGQGNCGLAGFDVLCGDAIARLELTVNSRDPRDVALHHPT